MQNLLPRLRKEVLEINMKEKSEKESSQDPTAFTSKGEGKKGDSCATDLISGRKDWFIVYYDFPQPNPVSLTDNSYAKPMGKGIIELEAFVNKKWVKVTINDRLGHIIMKYIRETLKTEAIRDVQTTSITIQTQMSDDSSSSSSEGEEPTEDVESDYDDLLGNGQALKDYANQGKPSNESAEVKNIGKTKVTLPKPVVPPETSIQLRDRFSLKTPDRYVAHSVAMVLRYYFVFSKVLTCRNVGVITSRQLPNHLFESLRQGFEYLFFLEDGRNSAGLKEQDLIKLFPLTLKPFEMCVFVSPTMLAVQNCDKIFDECCSQGFSGYLLTEATGMDVFVIKPSPKVLENLMNGLVETSGSGLFYIVLL
ncbi:unnamed protein product [Orchesella dallaii]|uniref:Uncharacterized protein n=1 Tax=Orchesella dallaii TaxID=48710 RepID=A0ABP1Q2X2_9HEXA